jgi:hypothetical protein
MPNPAEELRQAASLVRELAYDATRGPWVAHPTISRADLEDRSSAWTICRPICDQQVPGECEPDCGRNVLQTGAESCEEDFLGENDAQWIALMHPGLAKPLAVWLESWAGVELREDGPYPDDWFHAVQIARAINGGTS